MPPIQFDYQDFDEDTFISDSDSENDYDDDDDEDDDEDEDEQEVNEPASSASSVARPIVVEVLESDSVDEGEGEVEAEEVAEVEEEWNREEIDGLICPICMEPWCSSGDHFPRAASGAFFSFTLYIDGSNIPYKERSCLSCGHMFGMSCVKKWLGQCRTSGKAGKCPQCNKKCTLKDIRRIYGSRVVVVDEESQKRIKFLEDKCTSLEKKDAGWRKKEAEWRKKLLVCQKKEAEIRQKFEGLSKRTNNLERSVEELGNKPSRLVGAGQWYSGNTMGLSDSQVSACSFELQQDLRLDGARYFDVDHVSQVLVVTRRPMQITGPHVLTKMSLASPCEQDDVLLPSSVKSVRDVRVSPSGRFALLASIGKKLSVVSLESNNVVVNYDLPVAAWSCAWDINNSNHVYAGLQNGMVLVFDLRQTERPLQSKIGLSNNPVHSVYSLSDDSTITSGTKKLLTASSVGLCQWNIGVEQKQPTLINEIVNQGVCISVAYCQSTDNIIATYRPKVAIPNENGISQASQTQSFNMGQSVLGSHILYKRQQSGYQSSGSVCAHVPGIRLPKSNILGIEGDTPVFVCGDDSSSTLALQELPSLTVSHCLQTNYPIRDVKYTTSVKPNLLCCLSEDRVQLFSKKRL